jgi:hypothetical protein
MSSLPTDITHVLALDPGEKVGWARAYVADDGSWCGYDHGITALKPMALAVHANIAKYDVVIYETWRLRASETQKFVGNDFQSSQFIGMVRLAAWLNPQVRLVSQGPSVKTTAEKTAPSELRKLLARMPKTHDDAHDGDALLHLWHYTWDKFVTTPALAKTAGPIGGTRIHDTTTEPAVHG